MIFMLRGGKISSPGGVFRGGEFSEEGILSKWEFFGGENFLFNLGWSFQGGIYLGGIRFFPIKDM